MNIENDIATTLVRGMRSGGDLRALVDDLQQQHPDLDDAAWDNVFQMARQRLEDEAQQHFKEAEALRGLEGIFDGLPEGTSLGEALGIKAEQGDPVALRYLNHISSPEYRLKAALQDAALRTHPAWVEKESGFQWCGSGEPLAGPALEEWFLRHHPAKAQQIKREVWAEQ